VGARRGREIGGSREARCEAFHGRGLRDIERLSRGDLPVWIDERHRPREVASRQRMGYRSAELAGSNDRDVKEGARSP
jgi:hypothetical protein